jgi:hypothetical protein
MSALWKRKGLELGGCDFCGGYERVVVSDLANAQICEGCADRVVAVFLAYRERKERASNRKRTAVQKRL